MDEPVNNNSILALIETKFPNWIMLELERAKLQYLTYMIPTIEGEEPRPKRTFTCKMARQQLEIIVSMNESAARKNRASAAIAATTQPKQSTHRQQKSNDSKEVRAFIAGQNSSKTQRSAPKSYDKPETKSIESWPSRKKWPCIFCNSPDCVSTKCDKYKSIDSRRKRLMSLKKCHRCLKDLHLVGEKCPMMDKVKCRQCEGAHRIFLCPKLDQTTKASPSEPETIRTFLGSTLMPSNPDKKYVNPEMEPILMTKKVKICSAHTSKVYDVRVFLDPGSQASFVTDQLATKLKLEGPSRKVNIHGIFDKTTEITTKKVEAQLLMKDEEGKEAYRTFKFQTTPKITGQLAMPEIEATELESIKSSEEMPKIPCVFKYADILIGMDLFWSLVYGATSLPSGLHLVQTAFGPIVCGQNTELTLSNVPKQSYTVHIEEIKTKPPKLTNTARQNEEPAVHPNPNQSGNLKQLE